MVELRIISLFELVLELFDACLEGLFLVLVFLLKSKDLVVSTVGLSAFSVAAERELLGLKHSALDFFFEVYVHAQLVFVLFA